MKQNAEEVNKVKIKTNEALLIKTYTLRFASYKDLVQSDQSSLFVIPLASFLSLNLMHLSIFFPRGEGRDSQGELDNFEKSVSNSAPICKNLMSKPPWVGHQICYII